MPGGDRTGPRGAGSRTGRGQGYCGGYDAPGFADPALGRGLRWRCGWRHRFFASGWAGRGYPFHVAPTQEEILQALKSDADWLKGQLEAVHKRIEELEK